MASGLAYESSSRCSVVSTNWSSWTSPSTSSRMRSRSPSTAARGSIFCMTASSTASYTATVSGAEERRMVSTPLAWIPLQHSRPSRPGSCTIATYRFFAMLTNGSASFSASRVMSCRNCAETAAAAVSAMSNAAWMLRLLSGMLMNRLSESPPMTRQGTGNSPMTISAVRASMERPRKVTESAMPRSGYMPRLTAPVKPYTALHDILSANCRALNSAFAAGSDVSPICRLASRRAPSRSRSIWGNTPGVEVTKVCARSSEVRWVSYVTPGSPSSAASSTWVEKHRLCASMMEGYSDAKSSVTTGVS
eukprot:scaffold10745_cov143-Isochrysis_galbana.AAC.2